MPVISQTVIDGPHTQADGSIRGVVEVLTDDARMFSRPFRAADLTAWDALLLTLIDKAQAKLEVKDSQENIDESEDIVATGEGNHQQRAVAYLKAAWLEPNAYDAYLLIDRFNQYRIGKGWSQAQVRTELALWGLTNEEFDEIINAYSYMSSNGRPAEMAAYKPIQDNWEAR